MTKYMSMSEINNVAKYLTNISDKHDREVATQAFESVYGKANMKEVLNRIERFSAHEKMMDNWKQLKDRHPEAMLLFRDGDWYSSFNEDAQNVAKTLGITLTWKDNVRHACFPHHVLDTYLPKLVRAGYRIAICDALE